MRIIAISGSPRSGNCERLVKEAAEGARSEGAEVEIFLLRNLKFAGCCGRDQCYHDGICLVKDEVTPVLKKIQKCDGLIIASPNYFNNVSGLMKNFMDRTNPYCKDKKWKGKKAAIMVVGGATKRSAIRCSRTINDFLWIHGIELVGSRSFLAEGPRDAEQNKDYLKKARLLGKNLAMAKN
ncbi:Iron-sulfur flavoprotein [Candidatus Bilamarchaeum dharawalense]|uniref:Iron-sulfur flavoprotein n=1 Tax=Candidatus Bilamarchaeum dharawalense TaxID=2885759 RepID=A0A5E4LT66_9ARCH|nr:Iron-sulfur flavoprotein [Candidatus Bilamarchaeum dharawalense]